MGRKARNRKNGRPRPNDNFALPKLPQSLMATLAASLESSAPSVPVKDYFPLVRLPRELRDMIYEKMLVIGVVRIQAVAHSRSPDIYRRNSLPNPRAPIARRATFYSTASFDFEECSYECATSRLSGLPTIGILQTCWQVYRESASLFYSRNTFFFDQSDKGSFQHYVHSAIETGRAFFDDRPRRTRKWFKSIKFNLGTYNLSPLLDAGKPFHCGVSTDQVADFYRTLRDRLKLDHLSILLRGWPPEVRLGKFKVDYHAYQESRVIRQSRVDLGLLLLLCDFPRVALEICAKPLSEPDASSRDLGRLVAFAAFLRSRLLKGGEALGNSNIAVHNRHLVEVFHAADKPEDTMCRRHKTRTYVVRCDDDQSGRSFLTPAEHPLRLWNCTSDYCRILQCGEGLYRPSLDMCVVDYPLGGRQTFSALSHWFPDAAYDYARSDDGDNDSLKDMQVDAEELEYQAPESLLLTQDDLVKPEARGPGPENFELMRFRSSRDPPPRLAHDPMRRHMQQLVLQRFQQCRLAQHPIPIQHGLPGRYDAQRDAQEGDGS
ncbi:hypothetical protein HDK90DRAFT_113898 [Phyllosticta capitalensis]|uniref:DUF7730 domain-containing protein n=2 Tax=Phyllosticta capitalensis TaxID=121624 RepID=A0ABR1Y948_9PEZI